MTEQSHSESNARHTRYIDGVSDTVRAHMGDILDRLSVSSPGNQLEHLQTLSIMIMNELGSKRRFGADMDPHGIFIQLEKLLPETLSAADRRLVLANLLWHYMNTFCETVESPDVAAAA